MASVRREMRACRWCGHTRSFEVQLVMLDATDATTGVAQLVTDAKCIAADRVLRGLTCEAPLFSVGSSSRHGKVAHAKRRK